MRWAVIRLLRALRVPVLITVDLTAWFAATWIATVLRLETWDTSLVLTQVAGGRSVPLYGVAALAGFATVMHVLLAWALRLHQGRSKLGSFEELFVLASIVLAAGVIATAINVMAPDPLVPRTVPVVATCFAIVLAAWPRGLWRILVSNPKPNRYGIVSTPVILAGAGEGGMQLVDSMQRDPKRQWLPVGFVDDDRRKRHFRHRGIKVLGDIDSLGKIARTSDATTVVVSIPSADSDLMNRINDLAREAELDVKVLPPVSDLLSGVHVTEVRDLEPVDLLGRRQIETDIESIAGYLADKRVLVTGAGGSIGSELCRQIARFGPAELMMLDRDESALHALSLSLYGRADLESRSLILANIRESDRVLEVMRACRPDVVFHAAALKHVSLLEHHPAEAVKTNVMGTLNVLEASAAVGVEMFVNISTDKAADPVNVLGYTKRIAEGLTAAFAAQPTGTYISVRFGNVLGTRGSVLKTFESQLTSGGPLTVTDPEVTRYFMTINEAVQLVIQAAAIGRDGEALVLDMGEPVRIADVARQMAHHSDKPIDISFTGLKAGEKMHEVLFGEGEQDVRHIHPLVSHVQVPSVSRDDAASMLGVEDDRTLSLLRDLVESMSQRMRAKATV
jgi:FlaA1/EpsC-like NDP-sugar epimerase